MSDHCVFSIHGQLGDPIDILKFMIVIWDQEQLPEDEPTKVVDKNNSNYFSNDSDGTTLDDLNRNQICSYLCPKMAGISCFMINSCSIHMKILMIEFLVVASIILAFGLLIYKYVFMILFRKYRHKRQFIVEKSSKDSKGSSSEEEVYKSQMVLVFNENDTI